MWCAVRPLKPERHGLVALTSLGRYRLILLAKREKI
jgi:hypothetical protein